MMTRLYEDDFIQDNFDVIEVVSPFTCLICLGIAQRPLKCSKCETVYCTACLNPKEKTHSKKYSCFKMCGSRTLVALSKIERNLLNVLEFTCSQDECGEAIKYENYWKHVTETCKNKITINADEETRLDNIYLQTIGKPTAVNVMPKET